MFLKPEIISHLNIQVSGQSKQPPGSLVITFPNLIPSVDPFVVETTEDWKIKVNCLTQNFVWTLIEDPRGCYDRDVSAFVKETTIFLQPCLSSKAPQ